MKSIKVTYEWDCETVDEYGDVLNHNHGDLAHVLRASIETPEAGHHFEVVLVRDASDYVDGIWDGLKDRQWAYVADGNLPQTFDGGVKVPGRFHAEWKRR